MNESVKKSFENVLVNCYELCSRAIRKHRSHKYTASKIDDIMGFNTINIYCNIISGIKDNGKENYILYSFNLTKPPGYMIKNIPTNVLYQNVAKDRIEYIGFSIKDEHDILIDFNGDSFTLHLE